MNNIIRCIRCGYEAEGWTTDGIDDCPECREKAVVSFVVAADLLNELYTHYSDNEEFDEWITNIRGEL